MRLFEQWPESIVPRQEWEPRWLYGLRYRWWLRPWRPDLRERKRIAAAWMVSLADVPPVSSSRDTPWCGFCRIYNNHTTDECLNREER